MKAPVARAAPVLVEEASDKLVIEEITPSHRRVHQELFQLDARLPSEPTCDRSAEAALASVENVARQNLFERALQNVLAAPAFHLQTAWNAHRVLDQLVV